MNRIRRYSYVLILTVGLAAGLIGQLLLSAGRGASAVQSSSTPDLKPDIVVFLTDDLDQNSLDVALASGFMPNLRHFMIDEGTTFENSFVTNSLCCPSRATLLTGQYPHNSGVQSNGGPKGGCAALNDRDTLATWLKAAGYRTGFFGKYLNQYGVNGVLAPWNCLNARYIPAGWDDWQTLVDPYTYRMYEFRINDNGRLVTSENVATEYQTDALSRRASSFVREATRVPRVRPLFLLVAPPIPHFSNHAPASCSTNFGSMATIPPAPRSEGSASLIGLLRFGSYNEFDISDKPVFYQQFSQLTASDDACMEKLFRDRLESLRAVDDLISSVIQGLTRGEPLRNTVLIFTSDNGFLLGQHRLMYKVWPYEESIRVPLYIRAPGIPGGQRTSLFALNTDLAPTIVDFAGATPTIAADGSSLRPVLQNPQTSDWRKRIFSEWASYAGTVTPTIDPLTDFPVSFVGANFLKVFPPAYNLVRTSPLDSATPNVSYIEYVTGARELYDLTLDPYQLQNLGESISPLQLNRITALSQWIQAARNCANGSCQALERATTLSGTQ